MHLAARSTGVSVWSGVALVALGLAVNINAVRRHVMLIKELRSGTWIPGQVSKSAVALGKLLAIVGIAMAVYLLTVH